MSDAEPSTQEWAAAFARQAVADYTTWELLPAGGGTQQPIALSCHRLLLLQTACEKLCKVHLFRSGAIPRDLLSSHAHIAAQLPFILRETLRVLGKNPNARKHRDLLQRVRVVAREIELLQPSVDDNERRPDNCEYPWAEQTAVRSPLDHSFPVLRLLRDQPFGPMIAKLLREAMGRA